jgi:chemotaxis protein MotB
VQQLTQWVKPYNNRHVQAVFKPETGQVVINALQPVLFKPNAYQLSHEGMTHLKRMAPLLSMAIGPITIEGHTDTDPAQAPFNNRQLSALRACAVSQILSDTLGLDARLLQPVGMGDTQPVSPNNTPSHKQKNRRVVLRFQVL